MRNKILGALTIIILTGLACGLPVVGNRPPPAAQPEPTAGAAVSEILLYMVALEDNGATGTPVGCGDSLIAVRREITPTTQPVRAALDTLLAEKSQYYGESGLYNALYQSSLSVQSIEVSAEGEAVVKLSGQVVLGGTCDAPRFKAQIVQTVFDAGRFQWVEVFINDQPIDEVLSQR